jgi:hypothetical protein
MPVQPKPTTAEPELTTAEPAAPLRLRRLEVDARGGCVSDNDERVLCWGATSWPHDEVPASQATLREARLVDLGQPEAKIVDVAMSTRVCALFDDERYRCRFTPSSAFETTFAGPGARKLVPDYSAERRREHDCVLAGAQLRCGGVEIEPIAVLAALIPAMTLLWLGAVIGLLGAVVGIPAGVVYHARLWRSLQAENQSTENFWLRPHALHDKLSEQRLRPVRAWFAIGVLGFGMTMLGGTSVAIALIRLFAG